MSLPEWLSGVKPASSQHVLSHAHVEHRDVVDRVAVGAGGVEAEEPLLAHALAPAVELLDEM